MNQTTALKIKARASPYIHANKLLSTEGREGKFQEYWLINKTTAFFIAGYCLDSVQMNKIHSKKFSG